MAGSARAAARQATTSRADALGSERRAATRVRVNAELEIRGRVQSAERSPLAGALVCAPAPGASCCDPEACTLSGPDGEFRLRALPHAPRTLVAAAPGHDTLTRELTGAGPVLLTLQRGAAGRVSGHVLDATGGPVPGALVSARAPAAPGHGLQLAQTDVNGAFELRIAAREVELSARADAYSSGSTSVRVPAEAVQIVLGPGARLCGRVIANDGGGPVAGAYVHATSDNGLYASQLPVQTAGDGSFCHEALPAGGYTLWVAGGGWRSERSWQLVRPHEALDVVLAARPAGSLSASLRLEGGLCPAGSLELQGPERAFARTSDAGRVLLEGLVPGSYRALLHCEGAAPLEERIEIGLQPLSREWTLSAGLGLQGRVVRSSGGPVPGMGVFVTPEGKLAEAGVAAPLRALSDEQGAFRVSGLLAGTYALGLDGPAHALLPPVRIEVGEHAEPIVLEAAPEGEIRASFAGSGASVAPLGVLASPGDGVTWIEAERRGEQFVLQHLALGTYRVLAAGSAPDAPGQTVELRHDGERIELTLPAPGPPPLLSGRVLDETGTPVLDAWVTARSLYPLTQTLASTSPALTNERGEFSIAAVVPGPHQLEVTSDQGQASVPNVNPGTSVVVRLPRFGSLAGTVLTRSSEPARQALLTLEHESGRTRELPVLDGSWQLSWAAPGRYHLEVASADGAAAAAAVLESGGRLDITLQLLPR